MPCRTCREGGRGVRARSREGPPRGEEGALDALARVAYAAEDVDDADFDRLLHVLLDGALEDLVVVVEAHELDLRVAAEALVHDRVEDVLAVTGTVDEAALDSRTCREGADLGEGADVVERALATLLGEAVAPDVGEEVVVQVVDELGVVLALRLGELLARILWQWRDVSEGGCGSSGREEVDAQG